MPKVTYINHAGESLDVEVDVGWSLMQGATFNGVEGIDAECGGACSCATCHCYVDDQWLDKIPAAQEMELEMLDFAECETKTGSRLSCQITMTPELDGLVVRIPEQQG